MMGNSKLFTKVSSLLTKITPPTWVLSSLKFFGASVIFPGIVAVGTSLYVGSHDDRRAEREKVVSAFQSGSESFNASVASYVNYILANGKPDSQALNQLVEIITQQYSEVDKTIPYLPEKDQALVTSYKDMLIQMRDVLPSSNNVLDMKTFWEATSKILVLQHQINIDLPS